MTQHQRMWITSNAFSGALSIVIAIGIINFGSFIWRAVPCWIGNSFPSVEITGAEPVSRSKDSACIVIHVHKLRRGQPLKPTFHVEAVGTSYSPVVGLAVHRTDKDCNRIDDPLKEHPLDARWDSYYGFDMPGTITSADSVSVTGHLTHHRWFGEVEEPIPAFRICPVGMVPSRLPDGDSCVFG